MLPQTTAGYVLRLGGKLSACEAFPFIGDHVSVESRRARARVIKDYQDYSPWITGDWGDA
jgi:hypothetical protein